MADNREKNSTSHRGEDKESRKTHIVFEEIGEVIVVEEDKDKRDCSNEEDKNSGI